MATHLNPRIMVVSIYMRDTFYGHAPRVNGLFLLNLERDVTHIHSVNTKICKVDNDSPISV